MLRSMTQDAPRADGTAAPRQLSLVSVDAETRARTHLLVIDDEHTLRETCATVLRQEGYDVSVCGRGNEALELVRRQVFDIVLVDLYMAQVGGLELLSATLERSPGTIVIVTTGNPSVESSLEALRRGAWDYLPKPFSATQLQILIGRAAHTTAIARETQVLRTTVEREHGHSDRFTLLGKASAFCQVIELARRVAPTDASVFITGESGSGKEMIAQLIHQHSRRASRPFVAVNCAALPEALLESEMFGHCKGAFTGAVRDKPGLLEAANGGTFFLDELMEMPKPIQAKLLRVIQDGVVRRVGSETTDAVVNVRFIAATNGDAEAAVQAGDLREDLYYRLRVVPIPVPPLRERPEDIPILAEHFLAQYWKRHRPVGADPARFSGEALRSLSAHAWRGNVRELQNLIEHVAVLAEPGAQIAASDLPFAGTAQPRSAPAMSAALISTVLEESYHVAHDRIVAQFETEYLRWLVDRAGGNMSKAARIAGVDRTTLYRLMERHGLHRKPNVGWIVARDPSQDDVAQPAEGAVPA